MEEKYIAKSAATHQQLLTEILDPCFAKDEHGWAAAREIEQLKAQLARCVKGLEEIACLGNGDQHGNSDGNCMAIRLLNYLPQQAHLDTEILRCVDKWHETTVYPTTNNRVDVEALFNAVQAKKEANNE